VGRFCPAAGAFLFVLVIVVSSESLLQTPEGMALKQALVWMMFAFAHFSGLFDSRCTPNCKSPLVAKTSSVSRHRNEFPVLIDVFVAFCAACVSLPDLFGHMMNMDVDSCLLPVCSLSFGIWFSA